MQVEEVFVEIPGYPNYSVSNYGTVLNTNRDRELKPWKDTRRGKMLVKLSRHGVKKNFYVARLVAQAFFVDFDELVEVHHLSDNFEDNSVTNLHLVDPNNTFNRIEKTDVHLVSRK